MYSVLPEDIIIDILSRLPVKSLLRFKCVCKNWDSTTLDPRFIHLHGDLTNYSVVIDDNRSCPSSTRKFVWRASCAGLLLEETAEPFPFRYRIRNPEMRKILELPNPTIPCTDIDFNVLFSSDDRIILKVVSVHKDENQAIGYEVLNLGNESCNDSWRPLKVPNNLQITDQTIVQLICISEVCYCAWVTGALEDHLDIQIDILDMENESYVGTTTCPDRVSLSMLISNKNLLAYNENLAFVQIVKDELHVSVLDDYKRQKWRKLVIKLPVHFVAEKIKPWWIGDSELIVQLGGRKVCAYDFNTRKVTTLSSCNVDRPECPYEPTLYTLKGMCSHQ